MLCRIVSVVEPDNVVPLAPPLITSAVNIQHATGKAARPDSVDKGQEVAGIRTHFFIRSVIGMEVQRIKRGINLLCPDFSDKLARTVGELPKTFTVAGVQPLDVQKLTGSLSVSAEEGVQVKTEMFDRLTEIPGAGSFFWYLVRAASAGGEGPAGDASAGPRMQNSSGSCP